MLYIFRAVVRCLKRFLLVGAACFLPAMSWAAPPAPSVALTPQERETLGQIEHAFQAVRTLRARFQQIDQTGAVQTGSVALQRPGKMNLTYDPPARVRVVADGVWLVFIDDSVDQVTNFPLNSSPAGLLLRDQLRFDDPDLVVKNIRRESSHIEVEIALAEEADVGLLTLAFQGTPPRLHQWKVRDAAGVETTVFLSDIETGISLDPALFAWTNLPKVYR